MYSIQSEAMDTTETQPGPPSPKTEMRDTLNALKTKDSELLEYIDCIRKDTQIYKKRHSEMKQQIFDLNKLLQQTTGTFLELLDNTKSALQMSQIPILNSRSPKKLVMKPVLPKAAPSHLTRRKIQIEPLDLRELQNAMENDPEQAVENVRENDQLSTIIEESPTQLENDRTKSLCVNVNRLPSYIMNEYLNKNDSNVGSPADNSISFSLNLPPEFESTPLKLEIFKKLGLYPCDLSSKNNFVNKRIKSGRKNRYESQSPVAGPSSPNPRKLKQKTPTKKKRSVDDSEAPSPKTKRPSRKAKPTELKEDNLRK